MRPAATWVCGSSRWSPPGRSRWARWCSRASRETSEPDRLRLPGCQRQVARLVHDEYRGAIAVILEDVDAGVVLADAPVAGQGRTEQREQDGLVHPAVRDDRHSFSLMAPPDLIRGRRGPPAHLRG